MCEVSVAVSVNSLCVCFVMWTIFCHVQAVSLTCLVSVISLFGLLCTMSPSAYILAKTDRPCSAVSVRYLGFLFNTLMISLTCVSSSTLCHSSCSVTQLWKTRWTFSYCLCDSDLCLYFHVYNTSCSGFPFCSIFVSWKDVLLCLCCTTSYVICCT